MEYLNFSLEETCIFTSRNFGTIKAALTELDEQGTTITVEDMDFDEWGKCRLRPKGKDIRPCRLCIEFDNACSYGGLEIVQQNLKTAFAQSPAFSCSYHFAGEDDDWLFGRKRDIPNARLLMVKQKIGNLMHNWLTPRQRRQLREELKEGRI